MKITGNEPAYPFVCQEGRSKYEAGLTIRQLVAKDFMVAMQTNPDLMEVVTADEVLGDTFASRLAKKAFEWADAFIEESNKQS